MVRADKANRAEASGDRRAQIIAAAIRVLAREGLSETSTRKIAREAGINQATMLYYFESKDKLLLAVLQEMMRTTQEIARAAVPATLDIREAIVRSLAAFWAHVEAAPELQVMQYELTLYAQRHPESAWLAKQQYDGYREVVEEIFRETYTAAGQTCATPFDALARFVIGGLDGLILQFISDRDSERARRDLDYFTTAVIALAEGEAPHVGQSAPTSSARSTYT